MPNASDSMAMKNARAAAIYARFCRRKGRARDARNQSQWVSFWLRRHNAGMGEERLS